MAADIYEIFLILYPVDERICSRYIQDFVVYFHTVKTTNCALQEGMFFLHKSINSTILSGLFVQDTYYFGRIFKNTWVMGHQVYYTRSIMLSTFAYGRYTAA